MGVDQARKQKLEAFLGEIYKVCDKYQMKLSPIIDWTSRGAFPRFTVEDTLPPKTEEKPSDEATKTPEPKPEPPVDNQPKTDVPLTT